MEDIIAGSIYDFAAFLTTRDDVIPVGAPADATPIAELVKEFLQTRGVSADKADVMHWQDRINAVI